MKISQSIINYFVAMLMCIALASSAFALHPQHMQGYNSYAGAFPYQHGQGQPPTNWASPPMVNEDYGGSCCGPRWFDFAVDAVFLGRTDAGFGSRAFTSQGIQGFDPPNVVLSASDLSFDWEAGVRASVRHQMNAVSGIEAVYMDALNWSDTARATSGDHDLYSLFSDFGNVPLGGFEETGQASVHEINYESDLDSVEVNWRHGFVKPDYKQSGAFVVGFRYVKLDEQFGFNTEVRPHADPINNVNRNAASMNYLVHANNDIFGPQIGGDFITCIFPSVMLGTELKAGVMANRAEQSTNITVINPQTSNIREQDDDNDISFLLESNIYGLFQFHPLWKARIGYQFLYLGGIATALDNFNDEPPFLGAARTPFLDTNGNAFYHGAYFGVEFGW